MAFNNLTSRSDAAALIPEEAFREIIQSVPQQSAVMRLARRLPNMSRAQARIPVLSSLVTAAFVDGDTGLKSTSEAAWRNVYLNAEEIAVIIPIPEKVIDDADYDIWTEVKPRIGEAIGKAVDAAIIHGTNKPVSWPVGLVSGATTAGNTVSLAAATDVYDAILSENGTMALAEADGFMVTGHLGAVVMKSKLRGLRDANGQPIFLQSMQENIRYALDGMPLEFAMNGAIDPTAALLISGDWTQLVYSIRQDVTFKMLTEATLVDNMGAVTYALAQQDMVALRVVMRLGWALPNPLTQLNQTDATRFPFGILIP